MDKACVSESERSQKKVDSDWKSDNGKATTNDSLDSGIAGLKDNKVSNNNNNHNNNNTNGCNENESAEEQYIVDPNSRTTYLLGKFLGKGGFAKVHELMDLTSNTVYAGKIIRKTQITKRQHMEKIAREILIHRNLKHDNVVRLHHYFEDAVNAYIILENCSRKSLVHVLKHRTFVTEPEVRYYLKQLIAGVQYIHSQKVIHRDLKPGNMLLTDKMVVKVGDFGLATHADHEARVTICGTPNYIAPEVLNKLSYSYEADIWAIGCIMYALLIGQPPFETATLKETYARILGNRYTLPLTVSDEARNLLYQLLRPNPVDRPSLEDILKSLFFHTGYIPNVLSAVCCFSSPMFPTSIEDTLATTNARSPGGLMTQDLKTIPSSQEQRQLERQYRMHSDWIPPPPKLTIASPSGLGRSITFKQKITSVLCSEKIGICRNGKQTCNAAELYLNLTSCISNMPRSNVTANPPTVNCSPLFVSKWIDYSNKYGFGFQLSDKSVGVLFNDNTRIAFTPDRSRVEFHDVRGKVSAHPQHSVPSPLNERLTLLRYFGHYMDEHLTDGGDVKQVAARNKSTVPHMKRWVRTSSAIIMELCSGTLQINFFKDHTKVIISAGKQGHLVTYINGQRQSRSYWLHGIAVTGCELHINERLRFASAVLREFAELEGEVL